MSIGLPSSLRALCTILWALALPAAQAHGHHAQLRSDAPATSLAATPASALEVGITTDDEDVLWRVEARAGHLWLSHAAGIGAAFSTPVRVNALPEKIITNDQERPQIAVTRLKGRRVIVIAWVMAPANRGGTRVRIARSLDGGQHFEAPQTLFAGANSRAGQRNLALLPEAPGALTLAWIDDGSEHMPTKSSAISGSAIHIARSADAGAHFNIKQAFAAPVCECCRLSFAADPDHTPVLLWRHLFDGKFRDFALARIAPEPLLRASEDQWAIDGCPDQGGALAIDAAGTRHWVWFTGSPEAPGLYYRQQLAGQTSPPQAFGNPLAQAAHATLWVGGDGGRTVHRAWREAGIDGYTLMAQSSVDGGRSWAQARSLATAQGRADVPLFVGGPAHAWLAWNSVGPGLRLFDLGLAP